MNTYIFDSNTEKREFRQLQLIEPGNDPTTTKLLGKTEIQEGYRHLQVMHIKSAFNPCLHFQKIGIAPLLPRSNWKSSLYNHQ